MATLFILNLGDFLEKPLKLLLKAGALVVLLILVGYLAWLLFGAPHAHETRLIQQVEQHLQSYHCAALSAKVLDNGDIQIQGYLPRAEDLPRLRQAVEALAGAQKAEFDLAVRIWPHCETVALLEQWRQRNLVGRHGLRIEPSPGHTDHYTEGERIIVKLQQPDFDGYLYVDYYTADGNVLHLYPNRRDPDSGRRLRAGEAFTVGERNPGGWEVGPPFGQELISVIATTTPLYSGERVEFEPASVYLPYLRGLIKVRGEEIGLLAEYMFVRSEGSQRPPEGGPLVQ